MGPEGMGGGGGVSCQPDRQTVRKGPRDNACRASGAHRLGQGRRPWCWQRVRSGGCGMAVKGTCEGPSQRGPHGVH